MHLHCCKCIPVKVALAVEKNRKVLLMMMRPFAPSAANASDATTTSGLGIGLSSGSQLRNSSLYVVFCQIVVHIPNFIQTGQKT